MTSVPVLDQALALDMISLIAEQNPGYRYERPVGNDCYYVYAGECSCLLGHVLHAVGVPLDILGGKMNNDEFSITHADLLAEWVSLTEDGYAVLKEAQELNDQDYTWDHIAATLRNDYDVPAS